MQVLEKININSIRHSNGAYIALNIFISVCGLMFVIFRDMNVSTLSKVLGLSLGIAGIIEIIVFFIRDLQNKAKLWDFPFGMVFLLSGICFLLFAKTPVSVIPLIPGGVGIANAVFACKKSYSLMQNGKKTALVFLIINVFALALGAVVIIRPFVYGEIFSVLSGVSIMLSGISKAVLRFVERYIAKSK